MLGPETQNSGKMECPVIWDFCFVFLGKNKKFKKNFKENIIYSKILFTKEFNKNQTNKETHVRVSVKNVINIIFVD